MTNTTIEPTHDFRPEQRGNDGGGKRAGKVVGAIALGLLGLVMLLVVVLAFGIALIRFGGLWSDDSSLQERQLPAVAGAPEADIVMVVTPVELSGDDAALRFADINESIVDPDTAIEPGSVTHLFDVATSFDDFSYYEWSTVDKDIAPGFVTGDCFGAFGNRSSFATCGDPAEVRPNVPTVSSGMSSSGNVTAISADVRGLSDDAAWAIIDTDTGLTIAAQVVGGATYLEWPGNSVATAPLAEASGIRVLDADFNEIWTDSIG